MPRLSYRPRPATYDEAFLASLKADFAAAGAPVTLRRESGAMRGFLRAKLTKAARGREGAAQLVLVAVGAVTTSGETYPLDRLAYGWQDGCIWFLVPAEAN